MHQPNPHLTNTTNISEGPPVRRTRKWRDAERSLRVSAEEELRVLHLLRDTIELHHEALDDPELMIVVAEGETSLLEVMDAILDADLSDDALIQGLRAAKDTMAARLHRLEERKRSRRVIVEQALLTLGVKSLERPTATLSLAARPPTLVVDEEAQIPACFFDLKPVLNRTRAKQALEAGEELAGARLSTGSITITVRRR